MPDYASVFKELVRGIATLPEDEAQVLDLYYVQSCTWKEICHIVGKPYDTVRIIYWSAIDKLKPSLQGVM